MAFPPFYTIVTTNSLLQINEHTSDKIDQVSFSRAFKLKNQNNNFKCLSFGGN